jgi:hypothetical protein
MSVNTVNSSAVSHSSSKFYGHVDVVSVEDTRIRQISPKITDVVGHILLNAPENSPWRNVADRLIDWMQVINDQQIPVFEYQLEITNDVLVPYMSKLKGRFSSDPARCRQIIEILETLMHRDVPHPAVCLNHLDKIVDELRTANQNYVFNSELLNLLQQSQIKQWRPIVMDLRAFLQDIAGKLAGIAVITMIGWPMVILSPILLNTKKLMLMAEEFERHHRLSQESTMVLIKVGVLMVVLMKLLSVLEAYQSVGYCCGIFAALCMFVGSSENLIKTTAPLVAPNARLLDGLVQRLMVLSGGGANLNNNIRINQ